MKFKKFKSIDNSEKYVSLLSGHTFRVGKEWTSIPELAWQECYAKGCLSEDMVGHTSKDLESEDNEVLRRVMLKWYDNNEIDNFDKKSGRPKISTLKEQTGIATITNRLRDKIWFEIQEELK